MKQESILMIRPATSISYDSMKRWLTQHAEVSSIAVLGHDATAAHLRPVLAPRRVYGVPSRRLISVIKRYRTIVVLCVNDDDATTGFTVYRLLGELLFSDHLVLLGPNVTQEWPGGRTLITFQRARELAALMATAAVALSTTSVALAMIAVQEAVMWVGRRR